MDTIQFTEDKALDWRQLDGRERGRLLRDAVYKAYADAQKVRRSQRVGPSWIGKECTRELWLKFRHADEPEVHEGRQLRLFETGVQQEVRLIQDLRRVNAEVLDRDPNDARKQISISSQRGHLFGFLDGAARAVPFALYEWNVFEAKSHNAKNFAKLIKEGVQIAKPEHYAQMQLYMQQTTIPEAVYAAVCKDTDELHFEFVAYDKRYADRLSMKAGTIIECQQAPPRIHEDASYFGCKFCRSKDVCHGRKRPGRLCRTCLHSKVVDDGKWSCVKHGAPDLSRDLQEKGCPSHLYLPSLVIGAEQIDADDTSVTYKLKDGRVWIDRGPAGDAAELEENGTRREGW